jgi:hypothetical protein
VRAVASKPYQSRLPAFTVKPETVSHIPIPETLAAVVNGPNVNATELNALPPGEAAAPNGAAAGDWRLYPYVDTISEPLVLVGEPSDSPTATEAGLVGVAPNRSQSRTAFSAYALIAAIFLLLYQKFPNSINDHIDRDIRNAC